MSKEDWKLGDENKSKLYILPMLGFKVSSFFQYQSMPQSQFRNCFIGDNTKGINNKILLVYRFSPTLLYSNFVDTLRKHDLFENLYELDKFHTVFVFSVPQARLVDYNKIVSGRYSEISPDYKDHIIKFHELDTDSDAFGVLYKTGHRKEQLEEVINNGLPRFYWTKIPPFVELEEPFGENEVLQYINEKQI